MGWFSKQRKSDVFETIDLWCDGTWEQITSAVTDAELRHLHVSDSYRRCDINIARKKQLQMKYGFNVNFEHPFYYLILENSPVVIKKFWQSQWLKKYTSSRSNILHAAFIRRDKNILNEAVNQIQFDNSQHFNGDWSQVHFGSVPILHLAFEHSIEMTEELLKLGFSPSRSSIHSKGCISSLDYFVFCNSRYVPDKPELVLKILQELGAEERANPKTFPNGTTLVSNPLQALAGLPAGQKINNFKTKNGFFLAPYNSMQDEDWAVREISVEEEFKARSSLELIQWRLNLLDHLVDMGFAKLNLRDIAKVISELGMEDFYLHVLHRGVDLSSDERWKDLLCNPNLSAELIDFCMAKGCSLSDTVGKKVLMDGFSEETNLWDFILQTSSDKNVIKRVIELLGPESQLERDAISNSIRQNRHFPDLEH